VTSPRPPKSHRPASAMLPALRRNLAASGNTKGVAAVDATARKLAPAAPRQPRGMNRWEREYGKWLDIRKAAGDVLWWGYERVTLKLADDCRYTPDFVVIYAAVILCRPLFVEVKGFKRDDAMVKFRVAAEQNPWADFAMVKLTPDGWDVLMRYMGGDKVVGGAGEPVRPAGGQT
jgi:hypothetical protein